MALKKILENVKWNKLSEIKNFIYCTRWKENKQRNKSKSNNKTKIVLE